MFWYVFGIVWIVCGILAFGRTIYYFEYKFPFFAYPHRVGNLALAIAQLLFGIGGFAISHLLSLDAPSFKYKFIPMSEENSWQAYRNRFPVLATMPDERARWKRI